MILQFPHRTSQQDGMLPTAAIAISISSDIDNTPFDRFRILVVEHAASDIQTLTY
jgi:hypothetical protein